MRAMLKRIYDWCIDAADKPYALWILAAVAFAESSFFPVPPDIMLLPMSLARPKRAWWFATVCTIASVAGGVLGYAIGALLYDSVGQWLINLYGLSDKVEAFRASYAEWGAVIILVKGLTPIPYKLVTITSGFAGYNIWLFILCSIVARGGRFFVVAVLLNRYGDLIRRRTGKAARPLGRDRRPPCWCSDFTSRSDWSDRAVTCFAGPSASGYARIHARSNRPSAPAHSGRMLATAGRALVDAGDRAAGRLAAGRAAASLGVQSPAQQPVPSAPSRQQVEPPPPPARAGKSGPDQRNRKAVREIQIDRCRP